MQTDEYHRFTARLRDQLAQDVRVLGLVALGSMSGEPPAPDAWSDHDFFVITRPGEQERMRSELAWLPDHEQIAFWYRATAHGVNALYRSAHLLEFAVFDLAELGLARVNRYRTLLDRGGIEERMRDLRERTAREQRPDARWLAGQLVASLLIGADRFRRGERLAGRARLQDAVRFLLQLLAPAPPDSLDPLRRVEQAFPSLGRELNDALEQPVPLGAERLLAIARRELPDFPDGAAQALQDHLAGNAG